MALPQRLLGIYFLVSFSFGSDICLSRLRHLAATHGESIPKEPIAPTISMYPRLGYLAQSVW
ncbi:hypothetical protein CPter91_1786 [Collimonas pratensis]|uniref:Uncharacterized protein n=1 Tax=Collimonas pratensis TaxID=279113 RepID=A0A127Q287_9BURK|nr:hypothetical protein CPter91_1786 [Collimonas pratensis]